MGPKSKTEESLTEGPLAFAAGKLREVLPKDFTLSVLPPKTVPSGTEDPIQVKAMLAISLPEAKADLRLGLMRELSKRVGKIFSSDSRAPNGVVTGILDSGKVLDKVFSAINSGKLEGLTIEHLEKVTTAEERAEALAQKTSLLRSSQRPGSERAL